MLQHLLFVLIQLQLLGDQGIPFNQFSRGKSDRQSRPDRMVLDQMAHRVDRTVHGAAVILRTAVILDQRTLLVSGDMHGVPHQFVHAFVLRRGDRHDRHAQHGLHLVDVHHAAVSAQFVHHVQGDHHGHVHFQQLHGEIQIPLNVGGVHDVDDGFRLLVEHEIPGHLFLAGIRGHGIDPRQVGDQRVRMAPDHTVLAVHGHSRKIAHVLIRSRQLVEQSGLSAVLIAHQSKGQFGPLRQGIAAPLRMEFPFFAQAGVIRPFPFADHAG